MSPSLHVQAIVRHRCRATEIGYIGAIALIVVSAVASVRATSHNQTLAGSQTAELRTVVPLEDQDGRPVVGVSVNGHGPYRFLLDTGSTLNQLDPKIAASIGLPPTFNTRLTSSTGVTDVSGTEGVVLHVGATTADQQIVLLNSADALHRISSDIQGVLGQIFLSRFDYLLDMRNKRLEFGNGTAPAGTTTMFHVVAGRPVISTSLGTLVLDSGTNHLTRFGMRGVEDGRQMATASGTTSIGSIVSTLRIEGRTFWRGDAIAVLHSPETSVQGLLPIAYFKTIYVSNSAHYVVLD